jgi:hypothetical protein
MQAPAGHELNIHGSTRVFNSNVAEKHFPFRDGGDYVCIHVSGGQWDKDRHRAHFGWRKV